MHSHKKILFILTGGTISAQASASGLVAANMTDTLVPILAHSRHQFDYQVDQLFAIDSSNMQPECWAAIAHHIQENYQNYDGFIIIHGTDTMSYGAAALSYLIQNSHKPIIFTGSQVPLSQAGNDGIKNILDSITYVLDGQSYAVSIVFHGEVLLGTRARKVRSRSYQAFQTIDFTNRAYIRSDQVMPILQPHPAQQGPLKMYHDLDPRVSVIQLIPGMKGISLELMAQEAEVIIIEGFGIGGIPDTPELGLRESIYRIIAANKRVILTTQVPMEGSDYQVYAVGAFATEQPRLLKAKNITTEALVMKSMWALAEAGQDDVLFKDLIELPIDYDML